MQSTNKKQQNKGRLLGADALLWYQRFFLGFEGLWGRAGFAALRPATRPLPKAQWRLNPPQLPAQSSVSPTK